MLNGITIIDFTNYIPGPFATLRLAEMGAEVIKVEAPGGDPARNTGNGLVFRAHNRGKQSIVIDLKQGEGKKAALNLLRKADAVIESFRPGVMEKLGLGYEAVKEINPDIVYCSLTGYGNSGEMASLGSHDLNYMSLSGALAQFKDETGRPVHPTHTIADYIGGLAASERILAALLSRSLNGEGSCHCISIADSVASFMGTHVLMEKETGFPNGIPVLAGKVISYGLYETKDGRYVSLAALEPKFWQNFCRALDRVDWVPAHHSERHESNPVYLELVKVFKTKPLSDWSSFGLQVDCCLTPVLEAGELQDHVHFKERNFISTEGQVKMHGDLDNDLVQSVSEKIINTET
ncbi:CaiB/BaiF CoA transferase family protein [Bacillus salacetis]|uniref:CaiB/BaiF CoA transferase family protein n=1 Tax=Bacillus salacetis TaxID=2315464 RepID=UPI003BA234FC